jgi:hypothetical protein
MKNKSINTTVVKNTLSVLLRNVDVLVASVEQGEFEDSFDNEDLIDFLIDNRLAMRTRYNQIRPIPELKSIVGVMIRSQRRRGVRGNVDEFYRQLQHEIGLYFLANRDGRTEDADVRFIAIQILMDDINHNYESLLLDFRTKVNDKFGFVSNLSEKVIENEYAIAEAGRIIDELDVFDHDALLQLSGDDPILHDLFCSYFLGKMTSKLTYFNHLLDALRRLIVEFRHQGRNANLVRSFYQHWQKNKSYFPAEYDEKTAPSVLKRCMAMPVFSYPDLESYVQADDLYTIVQSIDTGIEKKAKYDRTSRVMSGGSSEIIPVGVAEDDEKRINELFNKLVVEMARTNKETSAIRFLNENEDAGVSKTEWLFGILSKIEEMSLEERDIFSCSYKGRNFYGNVGNYYLEDLLLCLKPSVQLRLVS